MKIVSDSELFVSNTFELKSMLESIHEVEVLKYDDSIFEQEIKTVLGDGTKIEEDKNMTSFICVVNAIIGYN